MTGGVMRLLVPDDDMVGAVQTAARAAALSGKPTVLTWRSYQALIRELGSPEAAAHFVIGLTRETGKPLILNMPTPDRPDCTVTHLIPPQGWSHERALGYLAGLKPALELEFGPVDGRPWIGPVWGRETRQQRRARERRERKRGR